MAADSAAFEGLMPMNKSEHEACVDKWMDECATERLSAAHLLPLFEAGFEALWDRARQTLGDVTLSAIGDRVLFTAGETFPLLAALRVEDNALRWNELRERARDEGKLSEGMRFVLVEFLTVLGNLTAEILTPALHSDLSRVAPTHERKAARGSRAKSPSTADEGTP